MIAKIISEKKEIDEKEAASKINQSISSHFAGFENDLKVETFSTASRIALAKVATAKKKEWFKTVSNGEMLGQQIIPQIMHYSTENELYKKVKTICDWCDND